MSGARISSLTYSFFPRLFRALSSVRARFVWLLLASLVVLWLSNAVWRSGSDPIVLVAIGTAAASVVAFLLVRQFSLQWTNHTFEERVNNFIDIMSLVRFEVVFVTGALHHGFYRDPEVIKALRALPAQVKIIVFHEREIDREGGDFLHELKFREALFKRITPGKVWHGLIADRSHCKIEMDDSPDDAVNKHVEYFVYDPARAEAALREIKACEVRPWERAA